MNCCENCEHSVPLLGEEDLIVCYKSGQLWFGCQRPRSAHCRKYEPKSTYKKHGDEYRKEARY
jgi:hypothetical protein